MTRQSPVSSTQTIYQPTERQLARAAALRRFNWFFIYAPLILGAVIVLLLFGWMMWQSFAPQQMEWTRTFYSGVADIVLIFVMLPMMLICAIGPLALIGLGAFYYNRRQEQKNATEPAPPVGKLQLLLWKVDAFLDTIGQKSSELLPKVARPVIQFNAVLAYIESWFKQIRALFSRNEK